MPSQAPDAIDLLIADHRKVDGLFRQFEAEQDDDEKRAIAREICGELMLHARAEEELFYPEALAALEADGEQDLVWEATVEHGTLAGLIDALDGAERDEGFDAHVKVLGEYVKHHVGEEEEEMFPKVRESGIDLAALGERIAQRKQTLREEWGLSPARRGPARPRR